MIRALNKTTQHEITAAISEARQQCLRVMFDLSPGRCCMHWRECRRRCRYFRKRQVVIVVIDMTRQTLHVVCEQENNNTFFLFANVHCINDNIVGEHVVVIVFREMV